MRLLLPTTNSSKTYLGLSRSLSLPVRRGRFAAGAGTASMRRGEISGGASLALCSEKRASGPRICWSANVIFSAWCSLTQSTKNWLGQSNATREPSTEARRIGLNHVSNVCLFTSVATDVRNSDQIWSLREETDMEWTL